MKGRSLIFSAILILVAGLVLILTYKTTRTEGIVIVGGVLFIITGLMNIFAYLADRPTAKEIEKALAAGRKPRNRSQLSGILAWISSGAAILLGLCLLLFTSTFTSVVPFMFALLITFGALYQFYLLAIGCRPVRLPSWLFIMPVLMLGAAIYVFIQKAGNDESEHLIMLITGISFIVFSATMFIESVLIGTANRRIINQAKEAAKNKNSVSTPSEPTAVIEAKALDDEPK